MQRSAANITRLKNESLSNWCTWKVGGPADTFILVKSAHLAAKEYAEAAKNGPVLVMGEGSNILFGDGGFRGTVIAIRDGDVCKPFETHDGYVECEFDSSVPLRNALAFASRHCMSGFEFAVSIPGSLGGAVYGNAGCGGKSTGDLISYIDVVSEDGCSERIFRKDLNFSYRHSSISDRKLVIIRAALKLKLSSRHEVISEIKKFASARRGQPRGFTAGCVFKNPPGGSAGKILDMCGCKGLKAGGAMVSPEHANFIINAENATADDILKLSETCANMVLSEFGIRLEYEVRQIGFER